MLLESTNAKSLIEHLNEVNAFFRSNAPGHAFIRFLNLIRGRILLARVFIY